MTPWKIAMEAAAKTAWEAWHWPASEGSPDPTMDAIRDLPEVPAFRAALEADEALLREAAEHIKRLHMRAEDAVAVLCGMSAHPSDTADVAAGMLAGAADRASDLLAKLEERRG